MPRPHPTRSRLPLHDVARLQKLCCTSALITYNPLHMYITSLACCTLLGIKAEPNHAKMTSFICTETWWQCGTCSSHSDTRPDGRKRRGTAWHLLHWMFPAESLSNPRIRSSYWLGSSCRNLVQRWVNPQGDEVRNQAKGRGHSRNKQSMIRKFREYILNH